MNYKQLSQVLKYTTSHNDFLSMIAANPSDSHTRKVYADWLEENGHNVKPETLHMLRHEESPMWVRQIGDEVHGGLAVDRPMIESWFKANPSHFPGSNLHSIHNGPGGSYFVLKGRQGTPYSLIRWSHYWSKPIHSEYGYTETDHPFHAEDIANSLANGEDHEDHIQSAAIYHNTKPQ